MPESEPVISPDDIPAKEGYDENGSHSQAAHQGGPALQNGAGRILVHLVFIVGQGNDLIHRGPMLLVFFLQEAVGQLLGAGPFSRQQHGNEFLIALVQEFHARIVGIEHHGALDFPVGQILDPEVMPGFKVGAKRFALLDQCGKLLLIRLIGHLQDIQIRLDQIFRRGQDIGDQILALHDILVIRASDLDNLDGIPTQAGRDQEGGQEKDRKRHEFGMDSGVFESG